jgi:hypothetical protein
VVDNRVRSPVAERQAVKVEISWDVWMHALASERKATDHLNPPLLAVGPF